MTTYYVRTTGSDAADGSTGTPWLTIAYALRQLADGDTLLIGDGTYAEADGVRGYLLIQADHTTTPVTIAPELGTAGAVTISGASHVSYDTRLDDATGYIWQYITFAGTAGAARGCVYMNNSGDVTFDHCTFIAHDAVQGFEGYAGDGVTIDDIVFTDCTFTQTGEGWAQGLFMNSHANGLWTNIVLRDCVSTTIGRGIYIYRGNGITVDGCTLTTTGDSANGQALYLRGCLNSDVDDCVIMTTGAVANACDIGVNAATGDAVSGTMDNCTITSAQSHGLLIGAGADGVIVTGCTITGGDQGAVFKACANSTIQTSIIRGGSENCAYFKGADTCTFTRCRITNGAGGPGIRVGEQLGLRNSEDCVFTYNTVTVTAGSLIQFEDPGGGTGGVFDYNTYCVKSPATWGSVRGTDITSLPTLRAAWTGYDVAGNDVHSKLCDDGFADVRMLMGRRRLRRI